MLGFPLVKVLGGTTLVGFMAAAFFFVNARGINCEYPDDKDAEASCTISGWKAKHWNMRASRNVIRIALDNEVENHRETKQNYEDAQAEADRLQQEKNETIAALRKEINDDTREILQADLDRINAEYERLLHDANERGALAGPTEGVRLPGAGSTSGRVTAGAGDRPVLTNHTITRKPECPRHLICLSLEEGAQADADNANHRALIRWAKDQAEVSNNGQ